LNLRHDRIGRALVVDPADFQVVALIAALEAELDIGVLGDGRAPVRDEDVLAVMLEGQLLDEVRRNDPAVGVWTSVVSPLDVARTRMLDAIGILLDS
jgi:hypothetical protein